jgi:hypothetical protein
MPSGELEPFPISCCKQADTPNVGESATFIVKNLWTLIHEAEDLGLLLGRQCKHVWFT